MLLCLKSTKRFFSFFIVCILISAVSCKKELNEQLNTVSETNNNRTNTSQPNVILFLADDLGYEVPTYLGGQSYETPNLDFMANNGMQFRQGYCHPDGFPSRLAMYTGKYNFRNYTHWGQLPEGEKTIGNLMQNAGYSTCFVGKWQCGGGGDRIHSAGYDSYRVFEPLYDNQRIGRYKNPILYENGKYLPNNETFGKYSEDMFYNYLNNFITDNKTKPFFAVYSHNLVAQPYVPSPDDPDYATWDVSTERDNQNVKYFPGMVKYMDKIIGKVIKKISDEGLAQNTLILFTADNATQSDITSLWRGRSIVGGKTQTNRVGTNIPFLSYWPGTIAPAQTDTSVVDFTDFLPTLADVAGVPRPTNYGTLDGVSFYDNLTGTNGDTRNWVYCYWDNNPNDFNITKPQEYVNNQIYKLYQTQDYERFYNIHNDILEQNPLSENSLTQNERQIKLQFEQVLMQMQN